MGNVRGDSVWLLSSEGEDEATARLWGVFSSEESAQDFRERTEIHGEVFVDEYALDEVQWAHDFDVI